MRRAGRARRAPLTPPRSRIARHVRVLGVLWLVLSAFHRHHGLMPPEVPLFVPGLVRIIGSLFMLGALLGVIAGLGLLSRQPWARMLAIVLGCLSLLEVPFGTALGIYTLWVLLPAETEKEWPHAPAQGNEQ